jgi:5-methylcytosine-specific restriction endonuclease McrA
MPGWCKTHAKREADRLCRLVVLERDGYTCQRCGATEAIQWCHILTRSELSLRWNPLNSLALCASCHVYMTHRPVEWMEWVDDHYEQKRVDWLRLIRLLSVQRGIKPDYAEIIASLRSQASGRSAPND